MEDEGPELLDAAEPAVAAVVAGLLAGAGPEGAAGAAGGAGRDEGPEPDGAAGGTRLPDLAGETCRFEDVPPVGEAPPGAPPAGADPLAEFLAVARWTGMSGCGCGCGCAGLRSAWAAEAGRAAGAGAGEAAADSVLLSVPRAVGALPARSRPAAGAGVAGRSWRETARWTGAPPAVLPPPVGLADGRTGALAAPETGAASAAAPVSGACPWRGRSGWGAGPAEGAGVGTLVVAAGRGGTSGGASARPAGARVALSVRATGADP
ncbi:Hypothetical protein B591_03850 [Streptomyces sp. GBA 94-10 4N24]|nr:Hypothetical protein B591_03850 [Streptomyces sp. GBA 94-10 4N24]ESQ06872.1 Hypothetical protein B590_03955 [Streptomyces sp. PVA_94-07]UZN57794.1 Hypothetical protein B591N_03850 [Streptomyces sp. GBA 94-10 4N24]